MDKLSIAKNYKHEYKILVPTERTYEDDLYCSHIYDEKGISPHFKYISFYVDTFLYVDDKLFNMLNAELGIIINMYEEVIIENEQLDQAISLTKLLIKEYLYDERFVKFAREFLDLLLFAKEKSTIIGLYF